MATRKYDATLTSILEKYREYVNNLTKESSVGDSTRVIGVNGNVNLEKILVDKIKGYSDYLDSFDGNNGNAILSIVEELYEHNQEKDAFVPSQNESIVILKLENGATVAINKEEAQRTENGYLYNGEEVVVVQNPRESMRVCLYDWFMNTPKSAFLNNQIKWIDMVSALNYKFGIVSSMEKELASTSADKNSFGMFLKAYELFMSELNNRKVVTYYARSIEDICQAITIYLGKTKNYYLTLVNKLDAVMKKSAEKAEGRVASDGNTEQIYNDIIYKFQLCKNETEMENALIEYVESNFDKLGVKKYKTIISKVSGFLSLYGIDIQPVIDNNKCGRVLYKKLFDEMSQQYELRFDSLHTKSGASFTNLIFGSERDNAERLIMLLRFMLIVSYYYEFKYDYSGEQLIDSLNNILIDTGFKSLDGGKVTGTRKKTYYCTKGNELDYCILRMIQDKVM